MGTGERYADTRGHVSSVCALDLFTCAPSSSYRAFQAGKRNISRTNFDLVFGISDLPTAPAPLGDRGL